MVEGSTAAAGDARLIEVAVSPGELIDKISILEIKAERITDPDKLRNVVHALDILRAARAGAMPQSAELARLETELKRANEALWEIEDALRACEAAKDFGPHFVELARSVYLTNDRRAATKKQIDLLFGSALTDEKSYESY
ncbi:MAG: DUF6165 family protein [Kiloniellales bacterium]